MRLAVIGTGHLGLVCAAGFAQLGHEVVALDTDPRRIEALERGEPGFHEPGLQALLEFHGACGRLAFTHEPATALAQAELVFIAVGRDAAASSPGAGPAGVLEAARLLGRSLGAPLPAVVLKTAAPVGRCEQVREIVAAGLRARGLPDEPVVLSNPEFLREGSAVRDFLEPARIVIGAPQPQRAAPLRQAYAPLLARGARLLCLDLRSAELAKQAASAMLATRISFINEMAAIAEALGADVGQVAEALGSDPRIGAQCLDPGLGWGGAALPRDLASLREAAAAHGLQPRLLGAVEAVNAAQRHWLFERLCEFYGGAAGLRGRRIALWGLAHKPGTDDMRDAPSLALVRRLIAAGAQVAAYDPVALCSAARALHHPQRLHFARSARAALQGAHALVLATGWPEFGRADPQEAGRALADRVVFDGRNLLDAARWRAAGLRVLQVGRPVQAARPVGPQAVDVVVADAERPAANAGPPGPARGLGGGAGRAAGALPRR